ncbi:MAG: TerC family protein [Verrucomicrobiota bacterium]|nr:TerC family protein [Limisphaera sp.]MDW8382268.1 TerC family protein [Verrucomicrobiota bacterium]
MATWIGVPPWQWAVFIVVILFFLALDLGVFHRKAHVVGFREALAWTSLWVTLSLLFGFLIAPRMVEGWTHQETVEYITGYLVELSLSMDNVFVIAMIFSYFRVPPQYQHRVLFWGILGALVMRGIMIAAGAALVKKFLWTLYVFGAFLVVTGIKMLFSRQEGVHPERNPVIRAARRWFPVTPDYVGQQFFARWNGRRAITPLMLVLLMVETTDLIFAVDSIPAIFGITTKPFIVFTSNVFAILGLRSLYFVLANLINLFRYLKTGLSVVLVFIGVKMLVDPHGQPARWWQYDLPTTTALLVVATILSGSILASLIHGLWERRASPKASASSPPGQTDS